MAQRRNELGQPIGEPLPDWSPPPPPRRAPISGRYCRLEPLDADTHATRLYDADAEDRDGASWTYLTYGPFASLEDYRAWAERSQASTDPLFFAIVDTATDDPLGVATFMRITPASGAIEVGNIHYSPRLARTRLATEAMYLMMKEAFALGYRRYEWKCDALNAPSRAAARRLGFSFEGIFLQATVYKGRSRDTAWYSVIDREWPALQRAFERWLDPENFDAAGRQRIALSVLTAPLLRGAS